MMGNGHFAHSVYKSSPYEVMAGWRTSTHSLIHSDNSNFYQEFKRSVDQHTFILSVFPFYPLYDTSAQIELQEW